MTGKTSSRLRFTVQAEAEHTAARACSFTTLHNEVLTPVFMPVATMAALRTQDTAAAEALGYPVLLANTYHLLLRPGTDVFQKLGGIHTFMNWGRSVLTDSGGYQIFSLSKDVKITGEGASFKSYHDGKVFLLGPETSIETQRIIGSDIMMALDQCVASTSDEAVCRGAVEITARWASRSLAARGNSPQALFGIVQGACFPELRRRSAAQITALPFDGYAIGGLAVGESDEARKDITELTASLLPRDYPRYLMGVGTPLDLLEAVHRGVDMFDCILPTALAQQGVAYTSQGRRDLKRGVYKYSNRPLDEACGCAACTRYTRAYLHHLIKTGEYYGANLVGLHNLAFYSGLMDTMRSHILSGGFASYYRGAREALARDDDEHPSVPPRRKKRRGSLRLGAFEIARHESGFHSVRHNASGEIMHSMTEPLAEAEALYVRQSRIGEMLSSPQEDGAVIWDVGLGAGTNAMAAILEAERIFAAGTALRALKIVSFEKDLDALRLAVRNAPLFPHVRHAAPKRILESGAWRSARFPVEWFLIEGDFLETMESAPPPERIYYDPFSLNTDGPLWRYGAFRRVYGCCCNRPARLFTYSASTQVRGAMLAAGFYVGTGAPAGPKSGTTAAFSSIEEGTGGIELLGADWLERFRRSDSKFAPECQPEERTEIERRVLEHPQFAAVTQSHHTN